MSIESDGLCLHCGADLMQEKQLRAAESECARLTSELAAMTTSRDKLRDAIEAASPNGDSLQHIIEEHGLPVYGVIECHGPIQFVKGRGEEDCALHWLVYDEESFRCEYEPVGYLCEQPDSYRERLESELREERERHAETQQRWADDTQLVQRVFKQSHATQLANQEKEWRAACLSERGRAEEAERKLSASEAALAPLNSRRRESRQLLRRMVKYVREDRADTPGSTRLARLVDQVDDYLSRTNDPRDILRAEPPQPEACSTCKGAGKCMQMVSLGGRPAKALELRCPDCNGSGHAPPAASGPATGAKP